MYDFLGRLAANHPRTICLAWLLVAIVLTVVAPAWQNHAQDDDIHFLPADCASVRGYQLLEQAFPRDVFASRAVFVFERADHPLSPADLILVDRAVEAINAVHRKYPELPISGVKSHRDGLVGSRLTSPDRRSTLIQVALSTPYLAVQTRDVVDQLEAAVRAAFADAADAPEMHVTGPAGVGRDLVRGSAESLDRTTLATVVLVVAILLLVYRSPILALVPLATIGVAVWVSLHLLAVVSLLPGIRLVNISQVFLVVILFGAGTDYCLFLISRFREELQNGQTFDSALRGSVRGVGGALTASAATVVCGLGMMGFAEFGKIRCAGPVIGLSLAVGLAASLTLTPALLRIGGRMVFWPWSGRIRRDTDLQRNGFWDRMSRWVVMRPGWVLGGSLCLLLPTATFGLMVTPTYSPVGDLSPSAESICGLESIRRHFTAGEIGPLTVLLGSDRDWDSTEGRKLIRHLCGGFANLEGIAEIRSLTQPLGQPLPDIQPASRGILSGVLQWTGPGAGFVNPFKAAREHYLGQNASGTSRSVTRLEVILNSDPFSAESVASIETIETWLAAYLPRQAAEFGPIQAEVFGPTVHMRDLAAVTIRDRLRLNALVLAGIFVILMIVVRRLWLAAFLLATVLLSYYATLGMTAVFAAWWGGKALGELEWRVPFFLFTILVAIGEDYNILLVTRALSERKRHGAVEGLRLGLARTGGAITACGLIMAGTFATLMLAGLGTLVQIGFALAIGVLLDTLFIRPFLVPAFMVIVWRDEERRQPKPQRIELSRNSERRAA